MQALAWVTDQVGRSPASLTEDDIKYSHRIILKPIRDDDAGCYRSVPVQLDGSKVHFPNPLKVPDLMRDFVSWLSHEQNLHPVELAAEAHYRLVSIHPFVDGNGRTARLLMTLILLMHNYPIAIIRKRDRGAYIRALEKAQLGGSKDDYFAIIIDADDRSLDVYLKAAAGEDPDPIDQDW